ncbi:MAG: SDR family oxidoreductase [Pseudolabrys sp.]|nr:SDR family oxidoreductase [Pseudolabrys sp.]MBV9260250.1 SDR family oxidoreductase [Pseudolabrys sp.]
MTAELKDKVVVITGGSRGIGKAIALAFAREGAQCAIAAASAANLDAAAREIAKVGAPPLTIAADLRSLAGCEQVFAKVKEKFGRCNILVNNAGATRGGKFLEMPDDVWIDGFALKFFGAVRMTRLFWPLLKEAHGSVINIIGAAARTPGPEFLIGGSVNAAFANFAKGLATIGNRDDVNVNVIHPGMVETDRVVQLFEQFGKANGISAEQARKDSLAKSGARRIGQPEDIAELTVFLARPAARHIQGAAIMVDGGTTTGLY